jgi:hypothetical protein
LLNFCHDVISICENGLFTSATITVLECVQDFMSGSICFIRLDALTVCICLKLYSLERLFPLLIMYWPSFSLVTNFGLKSVLMDVGIITPPYFEGPFTLYIFSTHSFLSCILLCQWVEFFCRKQIVGSCFQSNHPIFIFQLEK